MLTAQMAAIETKHRGSFEVTHVTDSAPPCACGGTVYGYAIDRGRYSFPLIWTVCGGCRAIGVFAPNGAGEAMELDGNPGVLAIRTIHENATARDCFYGPAQRFRGEVQA